MHNNSRAIYYNGVLAAGADGRIAVAWATQCQEFYPGYCRTDAFVRIFSPRLTPLTGILLAYEGSDEDCSGRLPNGIFGRLLAADGTLLGRDFQVGSSIARWIYPAGDLPDLASGTDGAVAAWPPRTTRRSSRAASPALLDADGVLPDPERAGVRQEVGCRRAAPPARRATGPASS